MAKKEETPGFKVPEVYSLYSDPDFDLSKFNVPSVAVFDPMSGLGESAPVVSVVSAGPANESAPAAESKEK